LVTSVFAAWSTVARAAVVYPKGDSAQDLAAIQQAVDVVFGVFQAAVTAMGSR
jgi:hypothetical protein